MARKKSEHETEAVDVSPFADSLEAPSFVDDVTSAPEVVDTTTVFQWFIDGEDEQMVSFRFPRAVLYALIDPKFEGADVKRAVYMGLLSFQQNPPLTELGQRILDGTDTTALRHKINTAYRTAHNRAVGPSRIVRA